VPFIAVLLLGLGELTFYVVQFLGAGSEEFEVVIMIEVVTEEMHGSDRDSDLN
jgi:hypothetical protein